MHFYLLRCSESPVVPPGQGSPIDDTDGAFDQAGVSTTHKMQLVLELPDACVLRRRFCQVGVPQMLGIHCLPSEDLLLLFVMNLLHLLLLAVGSFPDNLPLMNELIAKAPQIFEDLLLVFELLTLRSCESSQLLIVAPKLRILKLGR